MLHKILIKVGVLVVHRGKLLLIKEKAGRNSQYHWNIIKGTYDPEQDKSPFDTARREAKEEANAAIKIKKLLNILYLQKDHKTFIQFNFVADLPRLRFSLSDPEQQKKYRIDEEIVDIKLFSRRQLQKMKKNEFMGERTFTSVQAWLKCKRSSLNTMEIVHDY